MKLSRALGRRLPWLVKLIRSGVYHYRSSTWQTLRGIGNYPATRASPVIGVVGYAILFNDEIRNLIELAPAIAFDHPSIATGRLYCTFYGLTLVAIASLIYSSFCPPQIKKHADAQDYVREESRTLSKDTRISMIREMMEWEKFDFRGIRAKLTECHKIYSTYFLEKFFDLSKKYETDEERRSTIRNQLNNFSKKYGPYFTDAEIRGIDTEGAFRFLERDYDNPLIML